MKRGERYVLTREELRKGLPKNFHFLEKIGQGGLQGLDRRFPGWREREPKSSLPARES